MPGRRYSIFFKTRIQACGQQIRARNGKLYPDDLGEKVITRTDIDFVILIKERKD